MVVNPIRKAINKGETFLLEHGMFYKIFADIVKKLYFYKSLDYLIIDESS